MILSGSPLDYLVAFGAGVLVSFTPCVYPLIPVSVGYIGIKAGGSKIKGLFLSFIYASGIALSYALLGVAASLSGTIFGHFSSLPVTRIIVGTIIFLFGLSMFDVFTFSLPNLVKLPALNKKSYLSVFFLGLSSGLIVSPCLTPVLGSILFYLTVKKDLFYGASLLLSFAYGMSLLLVALGTFGALLVNLPAAGKWMGQIKKICAIILLAVGIYLVYRGIRGF